MNPDPGSDVAIIGGGIIGTAAAATLAAAGLRVTLYERGDAVAHGASGRNAGEICRPPDPVLARLFFESLERYRTLDGERVAGDEVFRVPATPIGVMNVAFDGDLVRRAGAALALIQPDMPPEILDGAALRRVEPLLAEGLAAYRVDTGYPVRPADATRAFAAFAARHKAAIRTGAAARPWIERGVALGVEVAGSRIRADWVIVAAGPWTADLLDPAGGWRPVRASWGVIVEVGMPQPPTHVMGELIDETSAMLAGPRDVGPSGRTRGGPQDPYLPPPILGVNPAPVPPGGGVAAMSLGGTLAPIEPDPVRVAPTLVEHASRFLPSIRGASLGAVRACVRPQSADGRPLIGLLPGIERLVVAAGNGAWGISTGPATARLAANVVLVGTDAAVPPELVASRFGGPGRP